MIRFMIKLDEPVDDSSMCSITSIYVGEAGRRRARTASAWRSSIWSANANLGEQRQRDGRAVPSRSTELRSVSTSTPAPTASWRRRASTHPKRVYDLTEGFIRRKYSDADIGALMLGGNWQRVLSTIWRA